MSRLEEVKEDLALYEEATKELELQALMGHANMLRRRLEPEKYSPKERLLAECYFEHFERSKVGLTNAEIAELSLQAFATIALVEFSTSAAPDYKTHMEKQAFINQNFSTPKPVGEKNE